MLAMVANSVLSVAGRHGICDWEQLEQDRHTRLSPFRDGHKEGDEREKGGKTGRCCWSMHPK